MGKENVIEGRFEATGQDLGTGPLSGAVFTGLGPCPHVLPNI
ncbi:MAG: hypothetical protein ACOYVK_11520 [Bacillota bacterium]